MQFNKSFIQSAINNAKITGKFNQKHYTFNIDTRIIEENQIFVALQGENFDGHEFIKDAIHKKASGIIINKNKEYLLKSIDNINIENIIIISVEDPYKALISLAKAWRQRFTGDIIGITGSVGKTSTKTILCNILKYTGKSFISSYGNQNNLLGLSLNLLRLRPEHEIGIFEVGISKQGEMASLSLVLKPSMGIITYIGHSHVKGLGLLSDISKEKRDLFKYFKEDNIGIINGDQPILSDVSYPHLTVKFGSKITNQVQIRRLKIKDNALSFILKLYNQKYIINIQTTSSAVAYNILPSVAAAYMLNIDIEYILKGAKEPLNLSGRFNIKKLKKYSGILIDDCYNSSPESMKDALCAFEYLNFKGKKIAIIGDMLELGVNESFWHKHMGKLLRKVPSLDHVIFIGSKIKYVEKNIPLNLSHEYVENWQDAYKALKNNIIKESVILIKGSRAMALNNIVDQIT